jgi:hypothetical protein
MSSNIGIQKRSRGRDIVAGIDLTVRPSLPSRTTVIGIDREPRYFILRVIGKHLHKKMFLGLVETRPQILRIATMSRAGWQMR